MQARHLIAIAAALGAGSSLAAIAPGSSGNGELFVVAYDSVARVSFVRDLGITMNSFLAVAQSEGGYSQFWALRDPNFQSFLSASTAANRRWMVMAADSTGAPTLPGNQRLLTTAANGTKNSQIDDTLNRKLTDGIGSTQMGTFFDAINVTGGHGTSGTAPNYSKNGTSLNRESDPGNSYFGEAGGTSSTLNGNFAFEGGNAFGTSGLAYVLTQSGPSPGGAIVPDNINNSVYNSRFRVYLNQFSGNHQLNFNLTSASVPPPSAPLLNAPITAAVPEPSTWALMVGGLMATVAVARRRRR